jgi:hypothetical protein
VVATDGVRKSVGWIAAAIALLAAALLILARLAGGPAPVAIAPPAPAAPPPRVVGEAPVEPRRDEPAKQRSHRARRIEAASVSAPVPAPGAEPPAREDPPFSIGPPGSGIALFPPRDTKPIKSGIVVPEDFELPEGYVRHFQANEDGELLAPILLFHPDYEIVDESGQAIEVPADRVVPPELAPEGLPIQMLEVPGAKGDAR